MLIGQKDRGRRPLVYPHASRVKRRGFTLTEVLAVVFISSVVIAALFLTLTTGEFSNSTISAKTDLRAKVRRIMDWIIKDVRQTNLAEINNNNPSLNHIKFKLVTGIDDITGSYTLSPNYIEYDYNNVSGELTRNEVDETGLILQGWVFNNITQPPFYTAPGVPLVADGILASKKLVVVIVGQNQVRSSLTLNSSLTEEARVRNE
ncbi:MAG: prepilin-type N-terminal cleavage/methylation domain-containing protein [Candidatus Omnitrophota bacterium]|nr:prepilin-type N-terminal cleavage/methylation domain-containing protein [Candidatus Omnitrophota bacterium]